MAQVQHATPIRFSGYAVEFSPFEGGLIACASAQHFGIVGNGCQYVLEVREEGLSVRCEFMTQHGLYDCAWSEDNDAILLSACIDGTVKMWDTTQRSGRPVKACAEHEREVHSVDWNVVRKDVFLSGSWDNTAKLWSPHRDRSIRTFHEHMDFVYCAKWSPHSARRFLTASGDCNIKLWSTEQPRSVLTIRAHEGEVLTCDWNKYNSNIIATGSVDGLVKIWDLRQPDTCLEALRGHDLAVRRLKWSPHCDTVLASCSYDMSLILWNTSPLMEDARMHRFDHYTEFVAGLDFNLFAPHQMAACSWENVVELISIPPMVT